MRLPRIRTVAFVCFVLLSFQARTEEVTWPLLLSNRLELQSDRFLGGKDMWTFNPLTIRAQMRVHERLMLDFESSMLVGVTEIVRLAPASLGSNAILVTGNITTGLHSFASLDENAVVGFGLSVTVPSNAEPISTNLLPLVLAALTRNGAEIQRFAPGFTFVRLPLSLEIRLGSVARLRSELVPMLWLARNKANEGNGSVTLDHSDDLLLRLSNGLCGGVRFQATYLGDVSSNNSIAASISPYVGYEPSGRGPFVRLALIILLTESQFDIFSEGHSFVSLTQVGVVF